MKRWLLQILAAASLLLGVASIVFWVRSYFIVDLFGIPYREAGLVLYRGKMFFHVYHPYVWVAGSTHWNSEPVSFADDYRVLLQNYPRGWLGFAATALDPKRNMLVIPFWFPSVAFNLLPVWWLWRRPARRRADRLTRGLCPACAYDLRAHLPGQKCPECGTLIPAKPQA